MPYAPGVTNIAGQLFAQGVSGLAEGSQNMADAIQRLNQNGKIADSIVKVNPEILGQLGLTPDSWSILSARDKTSNIAGAIKAMGLKGQQMDLDAKRQDTLAQAAQRNQQAVEDAAIGEATKRYATGPQATPDLSGTADPETQTTTPPDNGAPPPLTSQARLNFALQTPGLGGKSVPKLIDALDKMGLLGTKGMKGLAVGTQINAPDGSVITGLGEQNEPHIQPPTPKAAEGLEIGQTLTDKDGNVWVGKGKGYPPEVKLASSIKAEKNSGDTGRGRATFMQSAPELGAQLDKLESAIIKNNGNNAATTWTPDAVAALGQGPFQIAENYNKVVDPHSINRPEKLEQDIKHLLPMGAGTRMSVTLEAIKSLREELGRRVKNFADVEKEVPPNLPESVNNMLLGKVKGVKIAPTTKFDTEEAARSAGAQTGDTIMMRDPNGNYRPARLK